MVPTPESPIRILVVDDSAFMRKALSMMLESDPAIKVIGTARDGEEGVEKVKSLNPDLVTMDIEMPRMDGLTALRLIMSSDNPVPVMMVSSLTTDGAGATLDALEMGAVDFIPKQLSYVSLDIVKIKDELVAKIKAIVRRRSVLMARIRQRTAFQSAASKPGRSYQRARNGSGPTSTGIRTIAKRQHHVGVVAIGSSTGGPPALKTVISCLPRNLPVGVLVAQHMPATFTTSLALRLDSQSQITVREAEDGESLQHGVVYIAPGGMQMTVTGKVGRPRISVSQYPEETLYKPCVDVMMNSIADLFSRSSMGVILTGMGNNGLVGMQKIKSSGGVLISQNEETCIVYGMPRAVQEAGIIDHIAPIDRIASEISSYF